MAGCNNPGGCACAARKAEAPRNPVALADALAKVIVDNRVVKFTLEYGKKFPQATADEIILAVTAAKERGEL